MTRILILLFLLSFPAFSQTEVTFMVTDGTEAIPGATIFIKSGEQTIAGATDIDGISKINLEFGRNYLLRITAVGFKSLEQEITINKENFTVTLAIATTDLDEVRVIGKKPMITHDGDKDIVDPEPLVQSSTNIFEIVEKTPGVFTDSDGNIYLTSTTPAKIYINGREQKIGTEDLANLLKSLPPDAVDKIEVIRSPSANMDASATGGAINIVLKRGHDIFGSGSVSAGMNQGRLGNQFVNASYNRTYGPTSYYINAALNHRKGENFMFTHRNMAENSKMLSESKNTNQNQSGVLRYGVSGQITSKWELGMDGQLINGRSESENINETLIKVNLTEQSNLNEIFNKNRNLNFQQSLNTEYRFDSTGTRKIKADFSANFIRPQNRQFYNSNMIGFDEFYFEGNGESKSSSNFYEFKTDFEYLFDHAFKLESGVKISLSDFTTNADFMKTINEITTPDLDRINRYEFKNRIGSLYLQGTRDWGPYSLKAGTRLENTYMLGNQIIPTDTTFKIQRTDFFPFVYLGRAVGNIFGLPIRTYATLRRTISRPGYSQLNPYRQYIDEFTYQSGNPALKPQFANNYEINLNVDGYPIFAFGQNFIKDIYASVIYQDSENPQITNRTFDNLAQNKETYFRLIGAVPPGGRYFFVLGTQYSMNHYTGLYENTPLDFQKGTWRFFTFHQLKIDNKSSLNFHGFYSTKGQFQFTELSDFGNLNISINRKFLNDKLTVTLNASDVLFTNKFNFEINQGNISAFGNQYSDSRRLGINIRYNFGQNKKPEKGFSLDIPMEESIIR